jgi:Gpi18-like mannosyltransferase
LRLRSRRNRPAVLFAITAFAALVLRYCLAPLLGSEYDLGAFSYWAATGKNLNFFHFYYPGAWMKLSFPNYALYFPMLAAIGPVADATSEIGRMLLKTPAIFGDIFLSGIVYFYARPRFRLAAAAFILFNPAIWFDSAIFGQVDCFHTAFMLLAVIALTRKYYGIAWIWFVVAVFFKIQAIAILPVLVAVHFKDSGIKKMIVESAPAGVLAALFALPFVLASSFGGIWRSMQSSVGMFPSVSINAWNPWYLLHMLSGRWVSDAETVFGVSYRNIGLVVFALAAAAIIYALPKRPSRTTVISAACVMVYAFFMLPTEMHERYLYPFIPLIAVIIGESWVITLVAVAVSIVVFMDMNFAQPWLPAIDHLVRTVNQCVAWSVLSIVLFVIFFVWYMRRAAAERRSAEEEIGPSSMAK